MVVKSVPAKYTNEQPMDVRDMSSLLNISFHNFWAGIRMGKPEHPHLGVMRELNTSNC
jgi:hypothetical protein